MKAATETRYHLESLQTFADMVRNKLPDDGIVTFEVDLIRQLIGTIDALVSSEEGVL